MRNRKTPTWAYFVGILMMLIGGCGIKNDIQSINIREILAMKDRIVEKVKNQKPENTKDSLAIDTSTSLIHSDTVDIDINEEKAMSIDSTSQESLALDNDDGDEIDNFMNSMFDVPERLIKWFEIFGYIGLFFSFLFIIGGLFLMVIKSFSIKLAYAAVAGNILFSVIKWIVLSGDDVTGLVAFTTGIGNAIGIFFGIILFVIIVSSDQSEYEDEYVD